VVPFLHSLRHLNGCFCGYCITDNVEGNKTLCCIPFGTCFWDPELVAQQYAEMRNPSLVHTPKFQEMSTRVRGTGTGTDL